MKIEKTISGLRSALKSYKADSNKHIGFVPTMGNLHAGHISLIKAAKNKSDVLVASIFVNPTQFGAGEDFDSYPRTFEADCQALEQAGCDIVFAPDVAVMYGASPNLTTVSVKHITDTLCGASRVGHFDGVATVVTKLFNIVQPSDVFMGEKDYQQLAVVRTLVADLALPINLHGVPTVRAESGLALSSRNGYLTETQLRQAPFLYATLQLIASEVQTQAQAGQDWSAANAVAIVQPFYDALQAQGFKVDYLQLYTQDLQQASVNSTQLVVLVAAYLGTTRLIDNLQFSIN